MKKSRDDYPSEPGPSLPRRTARLRAAAVEAGLRQHPEERLHQSQWLVAELGGEDLDALRHGGFGFTPGLDGQIHHRNRWQAVPPLTSLTQQQWDEICTSEDWFVFGVLRDPRLRLFSAWQDKYLLRHPGCWSEWSSIDRPLPTTPEQVAEEFAEFCAALAADAEHPAHRDGHFGTQVHALCPDLVPYRRLYDMSELGTLMTDLNGHLVTQGHAGGLTLARTNGSPFKPCGLLFENGAREDIEKIYAEDFAQFGDRWDFSGVETRPVPWTAESFAHAHALVEVHERLSEVVRLGRVKRRREARLRRRVARLDRRMKAVRRENRRLRRRLGDLQARPSGPRRLASGVGGRSLGAPRGRVAGSRVTSQG